MSDVTERPSGAKFVDPSVESPKPPYPAVDFTEVAIVRAWLSYLREHAFDVLALGDDATKPAPERMFSRHELRRRLAEEERVLLALLDAGERGLAPAPAAPPRP